MPGRSAVAITVAVAALGAAVAAPSQAGRAAACPSLSSAARLPVWRTGGTLRADVDGDGRVDTVAMHYAPNAELRCGFLLTVRHAGRVSAAVVPAAGPDNHVLTKLWTDQRVPHVAAVVAAGGSGVQIAVGEIEGASNLSVGLFGMRGGKLRALPVGTSGLIVLYGSAGTGSTTARCRRGGPLTLLTVWPAGTRWAFSTRTYELAGARFGQTATSTVYGTRAATDARARKAGYNGNQFQGCIVAGAVRL